MARKFKLGSTEITAWELLQSSFGYPNREDQYWACPL